MPRAAPSACTEPGCSELVYEPKTSKCPAHRREQRKQQASAYKSRTENTKYVEFYNSPQWRAISTNHRKRYPLCKHCLDIGITKPADVVDHIIELRDQFEKRFDLTNLQSLCHSCHNSKTATVRRAVRSSLAPSMNNNNK